MQQDLYATGPICSSWWTSSLSQIRGNWKISIQKNVIYSWLAFANTKLVSFLNFESANKHYHNWMGLHIFIIMLSLHVQQLGRNSNLQFVTKYLNDWALALFQLHFQIIRINFLRDFILLVDALTQKQFN